MRATQSGVYCIINTVNGHLYVGSSKWIGHRWDQHRRELRENRHHCAYLQNSWNIHGEASFKWFIVEETPPERSALLEREQFFLDDAAMEGWTKYNLLPKAGSRLGAKMTDETRGKLYPFRPETLEKMRQAKLGRKHTAEHAMKQGASWRGKKRPAFSDEWRRNIAKARAKQVITGIPRPELRGVPRSEEVRAKISAGQARRWARSRSK